MLKPSMIPKLASDLLQEAAHNHKDSKKLTDETITQLHAIFGDSLISAADLLENCKITRYQNPTGTRCIFKIGANLERYTIYEEINFCQCADFKDQVLDNQKSITCKHVLALKVNEITNSIKVQTVVVTDSQFVDFLNEQLNYFID